MTESLNDLLVRLEACEDAREWARTQPDLATAWVNCRSGDWMLWLLDALDYHNDRAYRLIACACVRETPLPDGRKVWGLLTDPRSRTAVEVAERFAIGGATEEDRDAAVAAAWAAARDATGAAAWAATGDAAGAAARAAAGDAAVAAAWAAARAATGAAAGAAAGDAAGAAAGAAARAAARDAQSDIIRRYLPECPVGGAE